MRRFRAGDRIRVDIPDETDPDHDPFHGRQGTVVKVYSDDAGDETGDERDSYLFRVKFDDGSLHDFRWRDLRPTYRQDA